MNKLQIKIVAIILILAAGIYAGNLSYSGDQARAAHFMSEGHWDDDTCAGCHAGVYDDVISSYHVQQGVNFKDGMYDGWSVLINFDIDTGGEGGWVEKCGNCHPGGGPLESIAGKEGIAIDCNICHDQTGMYDWEARGKAIEEGRYTEANSDAMKLALETMPVSFGVSTDKACATQCHTADVKKRAVGWNEADYGEYDAHANNSVLCVECHITQNHQIGRGNISDTPDAEDDKLDGTMKTCLDCHEGITHDMAIDGAHIGIVSCEACHIPVLSADLNLPVIKAANWKNGVNDFSFRQKGEFTPVLAWFNGTKNGELPHVAKRNDSNATIKPFMVINAVWWDTGAEADVAANPDTSWHTGNPIRLSDVIAFDSDNDGNVTADEAHSFDGNGDGSPDYKDAVLRSMDLYFSVSHNIAGGGSGLMEALGCEDCHGYVEGTNNTTNVFDWPSLGYDNDPAQTDPPTDFAAVNFTVTPYVARPKPVEVERSPKLASDLNNLSGGY